MCADASFELTIAAGMSDEHGVALTFTELFRVQSESVISPFDALDANAPICFTLSISVVSCRTLSLSRRFSSSKLIWTYSGWQFFSIVIVSSFRKLKVKPFQWLSKHHLKLMTYVSLYATQLFSVIFLYQREKESALQANALEPGILHSNEIYGFGSCRNECYMKLYEQSSKKKVYTTSETCEHPCTFRMNKNKTTIIRGNEIICALVNRIHESFAHQCNKYRQFSDELVEFHIAPQSNHHFHFNCIEGHYLGNYELCATLFGF